MTQIKLFACCELVGQFTGDGYPEVSFLPSNNRSVNLMISRLERSESACRRRMVNPSGLTALTFQDLLGFHFESTFDFSIL